MIFCRKSHFDDEDYLALNIADEFEEEETLSGLEKVISQEKFHRPRKKRKKRRQKIVSEGTEVVLTDPDELPPRARWTIVATACLLLAMSLLLVGVTLRMAPIIDEMGKYISSTQFQYPQWFEFILPTYLLISTLEQTKYKISQFSIDWIKKV